MLILSCLRRSSRISQSVLFVLLAVTSTPMALTGCGMATNGMNAEGVRFFQQGNHTAAIRRFEQALANDPGSADGYYNLAATYHQLAKSGGDESYWAQAEDYYNQCLDRNPNHKNCYRGLAVMLSEQGRQDAALRLLQGWRQRNPVAPEPRVELARLFDETGDKTQAESMLLEAIAIDTTNPRARAALGKLREEQQDFQQAINNYQIALRRDANQPQLQARLAALTTTLGSTPITPSGDTRMATGANSSIRY